VMVVMQGGVGRSTAATELQQSCNRAATALYTYTIRTSARVVSAHVCSHAAQILQQSCNRDATKLQQCCNKYY
jgi:thiamine monophosphate kinase